nr:YadA-like family protein [Mitsuokella multacida]
MKLTEKNIGVNKTDDGKLKIQLAQELNGITSIGNQKTEDGKTTGGKITFGTDSSVNVNGGKITNVGNGVEKDGTGKYTVTEQNKTNGANIGDVQNIVNDAKKELTDSTNSSLNGKANVDASNLSDTNVTAWQKKLGNGSVADGNSGLVNGGTLYSEVRPADGNYVKSSQTTGANLKALDDKIGTLDNNGNYIQKDATISQNLKTLDTQVKNNTDAISNINTNIGKLSDSVVKYDGTDKKTVTLAGEGGTTITNVKDGALNKDSTDAVNGKQLWQEQQDRKDMKNLSDTGKTVIRELAKGSVKVIDGTNTKVSTGTDGDATTYAVNVEGNGTVESGNKGLISGGTAYTELRPADGSYVKQNSTTAANLTALDTQLKTTSDLIHTNTAGDTIQIGGNSTATKIDVSGKDKDGKSAGRVITGIVSDANDPNSAANVGYVNGITSASNEQIYHDMNMQYNHVENDISRAAAGSNALAALHPMQEFDPDDKAQFALGYGHYRNSNAGAVGAFYQPDENSMVNFGVSFGNGDAGINAGVTFKFGPGGSGHHALTKTQMAKVIDAQSKEIDELKKDNADKDKRIDALEQKMTEILAKLDKSKD